jgi:GNAT superfamily N-acetyltransferase
MPIGETRRVRTAVREEPIAQLVEQAKVSIAFRIDRFLDVTPSPGSRGVMLLREQVARRPYDKDYDTIPNNAPSDWPARFHTAAWGLLGAYQRDERVGGAVLIPPGEDAVAREPGVAVLWDLRVSPPRRRDGVGSALFKAAVSWARGKGLSQIQAETQNVNLAACRFYERMGCRLVSADANAYPEFPDEIRMIWRKSIDA